MTAQKSGWRSIFARLRGKDREDRSDSADVPTPESEDDSPAPSEAGADEEGPEPREGQASPGEDEGAGSPDADDSGDDDSEEPEGEPDEDEGPPADEDAEAVEDEDDTAVGEEPAARDEPSADEEEPDEEEAEEPETDEEATDREEKDAEPEEADDEDGGSREERLEEEIRVLRAEVARLERSLEEQSEARRRLAQEVEALADHDPLTGLASERRFADRLSVAIVHAQRYKQKLAVVQLGIDQFAKINDKLGRDLGDDVLKSVALALEGTMRQADTIARFGGDVFTILIPGLSRDEDMTVIADKLRLALRSPFSIGGHDLLLTASLGVALFPDDGPSVESLLHNASVALGRAKARGGDSWDVHAPRSRALAAGRQAKESALRRALVENDLELFWQPEVECETGAIVGAEALLRWERSESAESGFVSPGDVAGLAVPLGHWMLRAACRQGSKWHAAGHQGLVISVNVTDRQLHHPALLKLVRRVLDETSLPPGCLELEISENEIRRRPERTMEYLAQLRELGLRIALDGFGTGESRLGHLYRLPIDTLKIDASVVAEATSNHDQEAVINAAVALARSRKLLVVAEGVETEAQRVLLVRWQCDRMQGSLCGPPSPAMETEQLLLRQRQAGHASERAGGDGRRKI